eukprot:GHVN01043011.1.p1 GENE.GHVN01043011.1~~GHVN01043011.1.p1  ORF type:complete len:437 (+),score=76.82 GHVN01043011.1:119-1429(+)
MEDAIISQVQCLQALRSELGAFEQLERPLDEIKTILSREISMLKAERDKCIQNIQDTGKTVEHLRQRLGLTPKDEHENKETLLHTLDVLSKEKSILEKEICKRKAARDKHIAGILSLSEKDGDLVFSATEKEMLAEKEVFTTNHINRLGTLFQRTALIHSENTKAKKKAIAELQTMLGDAVSLCVEIDGGNSHFKQLESMMETQNGEALICKRKEELEGLLAAARKMMESRRIYCERAERLLKEKSSFLERHGMVLCAKKLSETMETGEWVQSLKERGEEIKKIFEENKAGIIAGLLERARRVEEAVEDQQGLCEVDGETFDKLFEQERVVTLAEKKAGLVQKIQQETEACEELVERVRCFEAEARDPARLFQASFRLLEEERFRRKTAQQIKKKRALIEQMHGEYNKEFGGHPSRVCKNKENKRQHDKPSFQPLS